MDKKVCVLLCTYNRKICLEKLLNALDRQSYKLSGIILVDNHSTDGTIECLVEMGIALDKNKINAVQESIFHEIPFYYYQNSVNAGGAGGFKKAFEIGLTYDFDFYWVMDDDVLPDPDCLEILISGIDNSHKVCVPNRTCENFKDNAVTKVNFDKFFKRVEEKEVISDFTGRERIEIVDFAFEGPLFHRDVLKNVGLPDESYFLLFDDSDYAYRCTKFTKIFFMVNAKLNRQLPLPNSSTPMYWKQYYMLRNSFVFDMRYGKNIIFRKLRPLYFCIFSYIRGIMNRSMPRIRYTKKAYYDARHNLLGKQVEPGETFSRK
ncbi:MAG: glycosyltransferase [Clostridium sp.]